MTFAVDWALQNSYLAQAIRTVQCNARELRNRLFALHSDNNFGFKMAASLQVVCPGEFPIEIVKWKVKKDSMVMRGAVLALYEVQSRPQLKLKSTASGIVDEILVEVGKKCDPGFVFFRLLLHHHII